MIWWHHRTNHSESQAPSSSSSPRKTVWRLAVSVFFPIGSALNVQIACLETSWSILSVCFLQFVTTKMKYNGLSEPKARHAIPDVDSVKGGSSLPLTESSILIKSDQVWTAPSQTSHPMLRGCKRERSDLVKWWSILQSQVLPVAHAKSGGYRKTATTTVPDASQWSTTHGHQKHGTKFPWVENPPMGILCLRLSCPQAFRGQRWCWDIISNKSWKPPIKLYLSPCNLWDPGLLRSSSVSGLNQREIGPRFAAGIENLVKQGGLCTLTDKFLQGPWRNSLVRMQSSSSRACLFDLGEVIGCWALFVLGAAFCEDEAAPASCWLNWIELNQVQNIQSPIAAKLFWTECSKTSTDKKMQQTERTACVLQLVFHAFCIVFSDGCSAYWSMASQPRNLCVLQPRGFALCCPEAFLPSTSMCEGQRW